MKNLLISLFLAVTLIACSSDKAPQIDNCCEARALVKANHHKIERAFADNDGDTIGRLELQNRDIIQSNMECFPKVEAYKKRWKKMHKNM